MFKTCKKPPMSIITSSGSICTFNALQSGLPLKSHTIALTATQSGSGTPSPDNVRPISGYSAINIHHASKNLLLITASSTTVNVAYTINNDGTVDVNGSNTSQTVFKLGEFKAPHNMTVKYGGITGGSSTTYSVNLRVNGSYKGDIYEGYSNAISLNKGDVAEFLSVVRANYVIDTTLTPMIIDGNETDYNFVKGDVLKTIQIGSTVYGGEYDARTGVLRVTHGIVDLGNLSWVNARSTVGGFTGIFGSTPSYKYANNIGMICSQYQINGIGNIDRGYFGADKTIRYFYMGAPTPAREVYIKDLDYQSSTAEQFKTAMSGVQLVYELATPTTIQLPPCPIDTLEGVNNIWADTGNTSLEAFKIGR